MSDKNFTRDFSPAWFASVMGTGILASTSMSYATLIPVLGTLASALWVFNTALFLLLLFFWLMRWIRYPQNAIKDLGHPVNSQFYPTMPIGFIVVAGNFLQIGKNYLPSSFILAVASVFWVIGSMVTLLFAFILTYRFFIGSAMKPEQINPSWFIPPVALIILPLIGGQIMQQWPAAWKEPIVVFNFICWSSGFFLYLFLSAIALFRLIIHDPLPPQLLPTLWINLGPIGAGVMALLVMAKSSSAIIQLPLSSINAFGFIWWAFGIWWFVMSAIMTIRYISCGTLPYAMSWWAFIFPLGAYVGASYMLYTVYAMKSIYWIGFALYIVLLFMWIITAWKTLLSLTRGGPVAPVKS